MAASTSTSLRLLGGWCSAPSHRQCSCPTCFSHVLTCPHFLWGCEQKHLPHQPATTGTTHYPPPTCPTTYFLNAFLHNAALRCNAPHHTTLALHRFVLHCSELHYLPLGAGCLGYLADGQTVKWRLEDLAHNVDHQQMSSIPFSVT